MHPEDKQPILSVVVPLYNLQDRIGRCLDSLTHPDVHVPAGDLEVLVVDDGSTDDSAAIAQSYAERFPHVVLLRKQNGGHGSAIDMGRSIARGAFLMVVDADDLVVPDSLRRTVLFLRWMTDRGVALDVLVLDRIVEDPGLGTSLRNGYRGILPVERTFGWDETRRLRYPAFLPMHSLVFRRSLLDEAGLALPEHTFYVDTLYTTVPLSHARILFYLPIPLYRYQVGRAGQSISIGVALRKVDDHLRIMRCLAEAYDRIPPDAPRRLRRYLSGVTYAILLATLGLLTLSDRPDRDGEKRALMSWMRSNHRKCHRTVAYRPFVVLSLIRGMAGRRLVGIGYRFARAGSRIV